MLLGGWLIFSTMTLIFMFGYFVSFTFVNAFIILITVSSTNSESE